MHVKPPRMCMIQHTGGTAFKQVLAMKATYQFQHMMYRWPDELEGVDWDYGVPKAYIKVSSPSLLTSAQAQVSHGKQSGTIAAHRCPMSLGCHFCVSPQN